MRQVLPVAVEEVDPGEVYAADDRRAPSTRPWVLVNTVCSADGGITVGGVSGHLGGEPDRRAFLAIRGLADVILAGAGTVRAESYGPPRASPPQRERRVARGQAPVPRLAIVSGSLELDVGARFLREAEPGNRPVIITHRAADAAKRAALERVADVLVVGDGTVDLAGALGSLRADGAELVVCEGGPTLNGQLIAAGLVDEWCLTVAPELLAGTSARAAHGPAPTSPVGMHLTRLLEEDGVLLLRYVT